MQTLSFRTVVLADPTLGTLTETYYWVRYQNGKAVQGAAAGGQAGGDRGPAGPSRPCA